MQKVTVNDNKPVVVATGGGGEAIATCGVGEAIAKCDGGDVATAETQKTKKLKNKNRIHVSHTKRPFFFYCNLAKRYIKQYNAVELSALGMGTDNLFDLPPFHPFLLWSQLLRVSRAMELLSRRVSRYLTSNIPRLYQKNMTAIDTYDDHRMAMAFSLAACGDVPVIIKDPGCTRKTFPDYFEVLRKFTKH